MVAVTCRALSRVVRRENRATSLGGDEGGIAGRRAKHVNG